MWPPAGHLPSLSLFLGVDHYISTLTRLSHGPTVPAKAGSPGRTIVDQGPSPLYVLNPLVVNGFLGDKPYAQFCHHHFIPSLPQKTKQESLSPFHRWGNWALAVRLDLRFLSKTKIAPGVRRDVGGRREVPAETLGVLPG